MNRRIVLASRPTGVLVAETFALDTQPVPAPAGGQILVRHDYLGLAPAARIRMGEGRSYAPPLPLGSPVYGQAVGRVVASRHPDHAEGDMVMVSDGGWQDYSVADGAAVRRVDLARAPAPAWLGVLGVSGFTAYVGMLDFVAPRTGETVVVSAASGAVGSVAVQIARIAGARVVGVAGTPAKCAFVVKALRAAACVDHRAAGFADALATACPGGIDAYFDNVGGHVRDHVWDLMNDFGRVALCGLISQYNAGQAPGGPDWFNLLTRRLTVRGFMLRDHARRYDAFLADMTRWLAAGEIRTHETIVDGLEATPGAFIDMLEGRNFGKTIVRLATP